MQERIPSRKGKKMNFPSEEKKNNQKQEKPCPQRETEASLQTLRSQRLLVSSGEISCCCTFRTYFF